MSFCTVYLNFYNYRAPTVSEALRPVECIQTKIQKLHSVADITKRDNYTFMAIIAGVCVLGKPYFLNYVFH